MVLYLIFAVFFCIMLLVSYHEEVPEEEGWKKLTVPFEKMAVWISGKTTSDSKKENEQRKEKWKLVLIILFVGFLFLPVLDTVTSKKEMPVPDQILQRPEKGEGNREIDLMAEVGDVRQEITVELEERKYTDEEKENFLESAKEELEKLVLGNNETADEVRDSVYLPSSVQNGEVSVQWVQDPVGLLDEDGNITDELPDNGEILVLTAILSCSGKDSIYSFALHLMPTIRTEEEELLWELQKAVKQAQEESVEESGMKLPEEVKEKRIGWTYPGGTMTEICFAGIILLAVLGYVGKTQEYKKEEKERKKQILLDYSDVVFKLGMLLNAGLTIQNAFTRVALEYKENLGKQKKRYAYEEMNKACNEMKSGISEANAYENFGRRCKEPCYIRLGNLLAGGLQKSAEGLTDLLIKEAETAMEDRKQLARKLGEEAGTKLVFPMIMMLLVVMVILMVPALLSF